MPFHAIAQLHLPLKAIGGNAAILDGRHLGGKAGHELAFGIDAEKRIVQAEMNAFIHFDMHHVRIEDGRLLREADDQLPLDRLGGGEGRANTGNPGQNDTGAADGHQAKCLTPGGMCKRIAFLIGHEPVPFFWWF